MILSCKNFAPLPMPFQPLPRFLTQLRLPIHRLAQRLRAGRTSHPLQPPPTQRFFHEIQSVRGDGRLLLLTRRMPYPDKESGQQKRHPQHRAARIRWKNTWPLRVEQTEQSRKQRQRPHRGICRRRKRIKHDHMRLRQILRHVRPEQPRKICQMQFPFHFLTPPFERNPPILNQFLKFAFVSLNKLQLPRVLQRKLQRLNRLIKTHEPNRTRSSRRKEALIFSCQVGMSLLTSAATWHVGRLDGRFSLSWRRGPG